MSKTLDEILAKVYNAGFNAADGTTDDSQTISMPISEAKQAIREAIEGAELHSSPGARATFSDGWGIRGVADLMALGLEPEGQDAP
jgi:hypothetical protein